MQFVILEQRPQAGDTTQFAVDLGKCVGRTIEVLGGRCSGEIAFCLGQQGEQFIGLGWLTPAYAAEHGDDATHRMQFSGIRRDRSWGAHS